MAQATKIICWSCKNPIAGPRIVIEEKWHCSDCAYLHDYHEREIVESKRPRPRPLQKETLFEPPPKIPKERRVPDMD